MTDAVRIAFEATSRGYSPDRVVADPELDQAFLVRCRDLKIPGSDTSLNRALLNLRKGGKLRGLHSKRSSFPDEDQYRFAAEIAARFIERRDGFTLDRIICDPELAKEFDTLAAKLAPGFSSVQYRWAALNLRKKRRLSPELLSRVVQSQNVQTFACQAMHLQQIPAKPGLYMFFTTDRVLYIGEAEDLNRRIRKHLDHSDNKAFAHWLWEQGSDALHLEIHVLPEGTSTKVRRALEMEFIRSRESIFNVKR